MIRQVLASFGHDPDRVREATRRAFDDPVFDTDPSLVDRVFERVAEWLGELLYRVLGQLGDDPMVAWLIAAAAAGLLVLVVWRWTRGVRIEASTTPESTDTRGRTAEDWLEDSRAAEERGDLDLALRHRYLAVVATLEERGVVEPGPGRTIRELDRELAERRARLHTEVADVGARVERVVYGGAAASEEDLEAAERARTSLSANPAGAHR